MPNRDEMINAAKKTPSQRTVHEQALVDKGKGDQAVRNADHAAQREERVYGK
nr:MetaGeneMark_Unknown Function [uncultured bacterium]